MEIFTTGEADYGRYIKVLFCGDPGSGKTLISSTFPNPFFASAEGGLMSIANRRKKGTKIDTSHKLQEVLQMAQQTPSVREKIVGAPVETIVIDTLDEVARILVRERCDANKKDQMAMGDWGWLGDQLRGLTRAFRNIDDLHVVFTCHLKSTEDSETGRTYFKPAIQGAMGDEIAGYVDLALLLRAQQMTKVVGGEAKRETVRFLQTTPDTNHPWVKDRSGKLPSEFEINFSDDFERMNDLIFGDLKSIDDLADEAAVRTVAIEAELTKPEPVDEGLFAGTMLVEEAPEAPAETAPHETPDETPAEEETVVSREDLSQMSAKEKMKLSNPAECEECGEVVRNPDQRDMAVVKFRMVLCNKDFKAAVAAKK